MDINSQYIMNNLLKIKHIEKQEVISELSEMNSSSLKEIKWIGNATIQLLYSKGICSLEQLKQKSKEELDEIITNPLTKKQIFNSLWY